jgi:hypothetical protein
MVAETKTLDQQIAEMKAKYQPVQRSSTHTVYVAPQNQQQTGFAPQISAEEAASLHRNMAEIGMNLSTLAAQYGARTETFYNTLKGTSPFQGVGQHLTYWRLTAPVIGNEQKAKEFLLNAYATKGSAIETVVGKIATVVGEQRQEAAKAREIAYGVLEKNLTHRKKLQRSLVEYLANANVGTLDEVEVASEKATLRGELTRIDELYTQAEQELLAAKAENNVERSKAAVLGITELLNIKDGLLDTQLSLDGKVSDTRRALIEHTKGVQTAREQMAVAETNYLQTQQLIDTYHMLEVSFKMTEDMVIENLRHMANNYALAQGADQKEALLRGISQAASKMLELNNTMINYVKDKAILLTTEAAVSIDDLKKLRATTLERIAAEDGELREWTEKTTSAVQIISDAAGIKPRL